MKRKNTLRLFQENEENEIDNDDLRTMKIAKLSARKVSLWAKDTVVIPPNFVGFITMSTNVNPRSDVAITPQTAVGRYLPRCIATTDDEAEVTLPFANFSQSDVTIEKEEKVARGNICEEDETDVGHSSIFEQMQDVPKRLGNTEDLDPRQPRVEEILKQSEIGDDMSEEEKICLIDLLFEYNDCFALTPLEVGCTKEFTMSIDLENNEVITYRPYRLSYSERQLVKEKIDELKSAGIVEDSNSPFASPLLIVKKKNGEARLCVDYRALNKNTKKDRYPIPLVDDQIERLQGKQYYTLLDLKSGYYQIPLDNDAKPKTAFVTPDGHYQFKRMPFGVANGPSVFQRMINNVLGPLRYYMVMAYMDDLIVPSSTVKEGLSFLRSILDVLRRANLTLSPSKCSFLCQKIEDLGFEVTNEGLKPSLRKTKAIKEFPAPENVHQVRQFLGLASYFRRFIEKFANRAQPLTELLKKDLEWNWSEKEQKSFDDLKQCLTCQPLLCIYKYGVYTEIHTDASQIGIGGVILQRQTDGLLHPIAYASRRTSNEEAKYHSTELETLAVVWIVEKFRSYLIVMVFKVITDCNAVRGTFKKKTPHP